MTCVEQAEGHRHKGRHDQAPQERATEQPDPQTVALLADRQGDGSALDEADVKADRLTPAFP
jgi:hypothetical protein